MKIKEESLNQLFKKRYTLKKSRRKHMIKKPVCDTCQLALLVLVSTLLVGCQKSTSPNLLYSKQAGVWIMADNGQTKTPLQSLAAHPQWASGTKDLIAFLKISPNGYWAIFTMDNNGQNVKQLTDYNCRDCFSWSPDRNWIVYESYQYNNFDIYKIKADGTSQTRLTNNPLVDENPAWSPKGDKIAYDSETAKTKDIFVMDIDGKSITNVTNVPATCIARYPVWSPTGDKIAFLESCPHVLSERLCIYDPKKVPNSYEISPIDDVKSFLFTPSGDYIIYNTEKTIYKQNANTTTSAPQILTTFGLSVGRMDVNEIDLFFTKKISSTVSSPDDGLYSLSWRHLKGDPNFWEIQLDPEGSDPDY
jgi:Tol biopolymer transport system component